MKEEKKPNHDALFIAGSIGVALLFGCFLYTVFNIPKQMVVTADGQLVQQAINDTAELQQPATKNR